MSSRIDVLAVDVAKAQSFIGSCDEGVIRSASKRFQEYLRSHPGELDDSAEAAFADALRIVVNDGTPLENLKRESQLHFLIAEAFVRYRQRPRRVAIEDYKYMAFLDFLDQFGTRLKTPLRSLFRFLVKGRPFIGKTCGEVVYGYLTNSEAHELADALSTLSELPSDDDEFVADLIGCLTDLRGKDLWFSF